MYDLIIIGGGPAGLTAGIYASRARLKTLIIEEAAQPGGQVSTTTDIENWPGIQSITGPNLMQSFYQHCQKFNVEFKNAKVNNIKIAKDGIIKTVQLSGKEEVDAKAIIISTGAEPKIIGVPGELEYRGKGVAYCATCDGEFYTDLEIVALGSGNTSLEEAVFLTRFVKKITVIVIHEEGKVDGDAIAFEIAKSNPKISFVWNSTVSEIYGTEYVEGIKLKNLKTQEVTDFKTEGIFMFVGVQPRSEVVKDLVSTTDYGYIKVNEKMETNIPGIFAAGDIIDKVLRQIVTSAADGAIAASSASKYLESLSH